MDPELKKLLDRRAIEDTLVRYADALDTHRIERFDQVFSADARLDYTAAGGIVGNREELAAWLQQAMAPFTGWQHLLSNVVVEIDGDEASARTQCYNPLARQDGTVVHVGCTYHDRLRRDRVLEERALRVAQKLARGLRGRRIGIGVPELDRRQVAVLVRHGDDSTSSAMSNAWATPSCMRTSIVPT